MKWGALICAVVCFVACSSGSSKTSAPTTTTVPAMSVQQVASIVAQHRTQVLKAIDDENECAQLALSAGSDSAFKGVLEDPGPNRAIDSWATCAGALNLGLSKDAGAIANGLDAVHPPAEVAALTKQTSEAARTVADQAKRTGGCLPSIVGLMNPDLEQRYAADDATFDCLVGVDGFTADVKTLQAALGGWDAYL